MWRSALCMGALSLAQAYDKCSDDRCSDRDEQAFLQVVGARGRENKFDTVTLLASVKDMAHQMSTSERSSPVEFQGAIVSIREALGMMKPSIVEEHTRAQTGIQRQHDEITACHSSASHGASVTGGLADELNTMTTCMEDQTHAATEQQRKCDEWTQHASRLNFPSTALSNSASAEAAYEVALSLKDWVDEYWTTVESQRTGCNEATTFATTEASRCGPVIAEYDETFCLHKQSCSYLVACHQHEVEVYNAVIADSQEGMTSRQNQFTTIQQVECITDFLEDAMSTNSTILDSSLAGCDENIDVEHLTLSFPDPPPSPECPAAQTGDPECPEEPIPEEWDGGQAASGANLEDSWELILEQDNAFFPESERDTIYSTWVYDSPGAWTTIGNLDPEQYRDADGKFHLRKEYTDFVPGFAESHCPQQSHNETEIMEWRQSTWVTADRIQGFEPIAPETLGQESGQGGVCQFEGVGKEGHAALLDANGRGGNWFNSIGTFYSWHGGMPGYGGRAPKVGRLYIHRQR